MSRSIKRLLATTALVMAVGLGPAIADQPADLGNGNNGNGNNGNHYGWYKKGGSATSTSTSTATAAAIAALQAQISAQQSQIATLTANNRQRQNQTQTATGGNATGGIATGGNATGGTATGGTGGTATGGTGGYAGVTNTNNISIDPSNTGSAGAAGDPGYTGYVGANVNISENHQPHAATAYAPSVGGGGYDCPVVGFGAGGQGIGGGGSLGPTWISPDCNNRKLAELLMAMGNTEAARNLLKNEFSQVRAAFEAPTAAAAMPPTQVVAPPPKPTFAPAAWCSAATTSPAHLATLSEGEAFYVKQNCGV